MATARQLVALVLLGAAVCPLYLLLVEAARSGWVLTAPEAGRREVARLVELAGQTAALAGLVLSITLPVGTALAVLLCHSDLPGRRWFRGLMLVSLFVPLPLFAVAWQAALRTGGWSPWEQGLVPAATIHALASLPWVVWLIGQGITSVEPELEEDALLVLPAWRVLWQVTFRRARPAFAIATAWVVVQTAGEIAITDLMLVRTFAEEVYTQFVLGGGLGGAVLLSLPQVVLFALVAVAVVRRWQDRAPPLFSWPPTRPLWRLGRARWLWFACVAGLLAILSGVPVAGLAWKAGGGSGPAGWSMPHLAHEMRLALTTSHRLLVDSLFWSAVAGLLAAGLALVACWLARESAWFRTALILLTVALWVVPGPVLGYGVKEAIGRLMDLEDRFLGGWTAARPLAALLYYQPTPLPVLWVNVLRVLPCAVALLWPAVRSVPRHLIEAARVDGAGPFRELRHVIWPLNRGVFLRAVLVGTVLALGELSAGKMVEVPGRRTFAQELFSQMHYGTTSTVAALCLLQLGAVTALTLVLFRRMRPRDRRPPTAPGTLSSDGNP